MAQVDVKSYFYDFGKNIEVVAICMILNLIPYVSFATGIISLIFMFMALGSIKNINIQLNNRFLYEFRTQYINSFVLSIVGLFLLMGSLIGMVFTLIFAGLYGLYLLIPLFIAIFIMLGSGILEMRAWENFKNFFQENKNMFPEHIWRDSIDGCDKLRTGALMYVLGFLLITLFIGFIFKAMGYFKLAKLKQIGTPYAMQPPSQPYAPPEFQTPPQPTVQPASGKFCPNCGTKLKGEEKFCGVCGSQIY